MRKLYVANQDYMTVVAAGDIFLLPTSTESIAKEKLYSVSDSGRLIFEFLATEKSYNEILSHLCDYYAKDDGDVECDLASFLEDMVCNGLILFREV